jgi:toxin ParE1/3/4
VSARYTVKPKADRDLDDYAYYFAREANVDLALDFLSASHDTFALLAENPNMGWASRLKNPALRALRVFRVTTFDKMLILYRPLSEGVDILRVVHGSRNLRALFRRRGEID